MNKDLNINVEFTEIATTEDKRNIKISNVQIWRDYTDIKYMVVDLKNFTYNDSLGAIPYQISPVCYTKKGDVPQICVYRGFRKVADLFFPKLNSWILTNVIIDKKGFSMVCLTDTTVWNDSVRN